MINQKNPEFDKRAGRHKKVVSENRSNRCTLFLVRDILFEVLNELRGNQLKVDEK